jgi:hypothetical protein
MRPSQPVSLQDRSSTEYIRHDMTVSRSHVRSSVVRWSARSVVTLAALAAMAACGDKKADTMATDTALNRDLAMAAADSAAQPKLQDVPTVPPAETPAPVATAPTPKPKPKPTPTRPAPSVTPTPAPGPAAPTSGTIASGVSMTFETGSKVCSNTTGVGEKFTAPLSIPVTGSNGAVIPAGATGTFEVSDAKTAKNSNDSTFLKVRLISVTFGGNTYPVDASVQNAATARVRSASKSTDAKKVAGGAVIGAIAGQIIGKNTKGTVIGAAAGAAAGTAAAAATADYDTCLNTGAQVTVRLDGPVTVKLAGN